MTNLGILQTYLRSAILGIIESKLDSSGTNTGVNNNVTGQLGMLETQMVLQVILETICPFISKIFFSNSIEHAFFEILIPKVKPIAIGIFYRPPNANDFLNTFSNNFQQIDIKTTEIYLLGDLILTYFKMESLFSKKISHMNLKIPFLP